MPKRWRPEVLMQHSTVSDPEPVVRPQEWKTMTIFVPATVKFQVLFNPQGVPIQVVTQVFL
jgi:hypothetical protein